MYHWNVAPICEKQLRDINPEDLLFEPTERGYLYRRCNTYKGGGGYDRFESIWRRRHGKSVFCSDQFVVQLSGCPLQCPYCYVTRDGIDVKPVQVTTKEMIQAYRFTKLPVFHLMGGAPAMYFENWEEIIFDMMGIGIFHSDFLLIEKEYDEKMVEILSKRYRCNESCLFAVSVKGADAEQFKKNTGRDLDETLFWKNLMKLVRYEMPFYITFTGMNEDDILKWRKSASKYFSTTDMLWMLQDSYAIELRDYGALH